MVRYKAVAAALLLAMTISTPVQAADAKLMHATAYTGGTVTATGTRPREGIAACDPAHFGYTALVYRAIPTADGYIQGELLMILECEDTGGRGVRSGKVLDIYRDDLDRCQELMDLVYEQGAKGRVFVEYVKARG